MSRLTNYIEFVWTLKFWFSLIAVVVFRFVAKSWLMQRRMAPGPTPWPIIGNFFIFMKSKLLMHDLCLQLSEKYGDPLTIFLGNKPCLVLTKHHLAKEVLQQQEFSDRFDGPVIDTLFEGAWNLSFGPYDLKCQLMRKTAIKSMRSLIDAEKLENQVAWACDFTVDEMLKLKPSTVEPKYYMRNIIYNIVLGFAFGKTFKLDDPDFVSLLDANERGNKNFSKVVALSYIPGAEYLPLKWLLLVKENIAITRVFKDYAAKQLNEHRQSYQSGYVRDFVDALLFEQKQLATEGGQQLSDDDLVGILLEFYIAGTETTTSTLTWFMLFMILHQDIQEECSRAITEAIGDHQPRLADRSKLPIVDACILETLRLRPPASMGLPRSSMTDTKIGEYFVPKGTLTLVNIYAMQVDPDQWKNPLKFDPRCHFFNDQGQIRKPVSYMPFGIGRRMCLGEQLAKNILFLTTVNLLQKIEWTRAPGKTYSTEPDQSIQFALTARPYSVALHERK